MFYKFGCMVFESCWVEQRYTGIPFKFWGFVGTFRWPHNDLIQIVTAAISEVFVWRNDPSMSIMLQRKTCIKLYIIYIYIHIIYNLKCINFICIYINISFDTVCFLLSRLAAAQLPQPWCHRCFTWNSRARGWNRKHNQQVWLGIWDQSCFWYGDIHIICMLRFT